MSSTSTPRQKTPAATPTPAIESTIQTILSPPPEDPATISGGGGEGQPEPPTTIFLYLADINLSPILSNSTTTSPDSSSSPPPPPPPSTVLSQLTSAYLSTQELLSRSGCGPTSRVTTRLTTTTNNENTNTNNDDIIIQGLLLGSSAPRKPIPIPTHLSPGPGRPASSLRRSIGGGGGGGLRSAISSATMTPRQVSAAGSLMEASTGTDTDTDTDNITNGSRRRSKRQIQKSQQAVAGLPPSLVYTVYVSRPTAASAPEGPTKASQTASSTGSSLDALAREEASKLEWIGRRWQEEWRSDL